MPPLFRWRRVEANDGAAAVVPPPAAVGVEITRRIFGVEIDGAEAEADGIATLSVVPDIDA